MMIIASALSNYNLGCNLKEVSAISQSKHKIKLPLSTISSWLNHYKQICTYARLRKQAIRLYKPKNIIFKKQLSHQQVYLFQIRNGFVNVLDYKPDANKTEAIQQLTLYALVLASRTKLALRDFKCAWFDEENYYEFFPLHAVYEKQKV